MCGRFTLSTPKEKVAKEFHVQEIPKTDARYNIAPTQSILAIRQIKEEREAAMLKWGLVPSWAKDVSMGARLINARSETVTEKPAFRESFKRRRCILPADGFYEWQRTGGKKQPFHFRMRNEQPFGFAGLWDRWQNQDGEMLESCTIMTTEANEVLRPVHDRMPVILSSDDYDLWLDEDLRKVDVRKELLRPYPGTEMDSFPVSLLVNSPNNQGANLLEQIEINSL